MDIKAIQIRNEMAQAKTAELGSIPRRIISAALNDMLELAGHLDAVMAENEALKAALEKVVDLSPGCYGFGCKVSLAISDPTAKGHTPDCKEVTKARLLLTALKGGE